MPSVRARYRPAGAALALCAMALFPACSAEVGRPHVLLVTVDTLRPDYLGANGYGHPTSPTIDELLAAGFYFEKAVTPVGRTTPALASLLTGAYPHATGVRTLNSDLRGQLVPLAERLREAGYQTLAVVTNDILIRERGLDRGFDVYDMSSRLRLDSQTSETALGYLEALDRTRPLFAWVHYFDPHVPYHPEPEVILDFAPGYQGPYQRSFGYEPRPHESRWLARSWPQGLKKREATLANPLPEAVNEQIRRLYAAEIRETDAALASLIDGLRSRLEGPLLIVLTADHGESLGEHGYYYDHGDYVYSAGTRVPLAFVLPRGHPLHGSGRCSQWVSLVDVAPTLLELLGLAAGEMEPQLEGRSLVPCMRGEALAPLPVFAEAGHSWFPELVPLRVRNDVSGRFRAVTIDDWKLIWLPFQSPDREWQLFDLAADPHETRDLYRPDHPRLPALRAALEEWLARAPAAEDGEQDVEGLSEEDRRALEELGYL